MTMDAVRSDDCTEEGRVAARKGLPSSSNPYCEPDPRENQWAYGWYDVHCDRAVSEGAAAFSAGEALSTCPYAHTSDGTIYGAWVNGWESQQRDHTFAQGEAAFAAGAALSTCPHNPSENDEMYRDWIFAWAFGEGAAAFAAGAPLSACPHANGSARDGWVFAWMSG
jgi:ribosome modulation factor